MLETRLQDASELGRQFFRASQHRQNLKRKLTYFAKIVFGILALLIAVYAVHRLTREAAEQKRAAVKQAAVAEDQTAKVESIAAKLIAPYLPSSKELPSANICGPFSRTSPRVYIHIRSEDQRTEAKQIAEKLASKCFLIPGIQLVPFGPQFTVLRYFLDDDKKQASDAATIISGVLDRDSKGSTLPKPEVAARYIGGYENVTRGHLACSVSARPAGGGSLIFT